jgi:hypothetical protein
MDDSNSPDNKIQLGKKTQAFLKVIGMIAFVCFCYFVIQHAIELNREEQNELNKDKDLMAEQLKFTPPPLSEVENAKITELGVDPSTYVSLADITAPAVYCLYEAGQLRQLYISIPPYVHREVEYNGRENVTKWRSVAVTAESLADETLFLNDMGVVPYDNGDFNQQARLFAGSCP